MTIDDMTSMTIRCGTEVGSLPNSFKERLMTASAWTPQNEANFLLRDGFGLSPASQRRSLAERLGAEQKNVFA